MGTPPTVTDAARIVSFLVALGADPERGILLTVSGEPRSKARPRMGAGRVYRDKLEKDEQALFSLMLRQRLATPWEGNLAVACLFYRSSFRSIDADNLLKLVLDAGKGFWWVDDRQITGVVGVVEVDADRPRTVVGMAVHQSTLTR